MCEFFIQFVFILYVVIFHEIYYFGVFSEKFNQTILCCFVSKNWFETKTNLKMTLNAFILCPFQFSLLNFETLSFQVFSEMSKMKSHSPRNTHF